MMTRCPNPDDDAPDVRRLDWDAPLPDGYTEFEVHDDLRICVATDLLDDATFRADLDARVAAARSRHSANKRAEQRAMFTVIDGGAR